MINCSSFLKVATYQDGKFTWGIDREVYNSVYLIHLTDDDFYIGSTKDLRHRFSTYISQLHSGNCHSALLQESFDMNRKFTLYVIEEDINEEELRDKEQQHIDSLEPSLNGLKASVGTSELASELNLRLKDILKERNISASSLASKVNLSKVSIYNIVNGRCAPSYNTLNAIAAALDVPFWELFVNPNQVYKKELTALVQHGKDFYSASTIEELETIVSTIKAKEEDKTE